MHTHSFASILTFFVGISFLISSCSVGRFSMHLVPGVKDHQKVFKCDTIAGCQIADPAFVEVEHETLPPMEQWIPREFLADHRNIDEFYDATKTTAFVVVRNDSILYEHYRQDHEKEDQRVVFSVTKSFVATLTHIAAHEGHLDLDQKVSDFIPDFAEDDRDSIRIRHLLSMTSGLDWMDHRNIIRLGRLYYTNNQYKFVRKYDKVAYTPGTHFSYKSISTQILGLCLEEATGRTLSEYLKEKIWNPLDMKYDALFTIDSKRKHNNRAFGGLAITARDLVRFGKLLLQKGKWEDHQLIPPSFFEHLSNRYKRMEGSWWGYASCFWRNGYLIHNHLSGQEFYAAGFGGQFLYIYPEKNVIILRMGETENIRWPLVIGRLAHLLGDGENDLTNKTLDFADQFEGVYEAPDGSKIQLEYLGPIGEHGRKRWVWRRNFETGKSLKKVKEIYQFDGISAGYKEMSHRMLLMFDIQDSKVVGLHFDDLDNVETRYFQKTHELPIKENQNLSYQK